MSPTNGTEYQVGAVGSSKTKTEKQRKNSATHFTIIKLDKKLLEKVANRQEQDKKNSNAKRRRGEAKAEAVMTILGAIGIGGAIRQNRLIDEYARKYAERGPYQIFIPDRSYEKMLELDTLVNPENPDRVYGDGCTLSGRVIRAQP